MMLAEREGVNEDVRCFLPDNVVKWVSINFICSRKEDTVVYII